MSDGHAVASEQPSAAARQRIEPRYVEPEEQPGYGWVIFAGVLMMIAGTLNMIYGIAAIAKSSFYVANTHFVFSELKTWGWVLTFVGAFEMCVAAGIWVKSSWARWTGVVIASLSAIAQLLYLPTYPWLSLAVFTLDVLVVYGLIAHGAKLEDEI